MGKFKDLTGQKFGHLTVLRRVYKPNSKRVYWECQCDCPDKTITVVEAYKLITGHTKSCGHLIKEAATTHGDSKSRLYEVWRGMIKRCYNINNSAYCNYGGRGILICDEWMGENGYENFKDWAMANGYDPNAEKGECTIDRIDNDKGYSPDNCRFVSMKTQMNNRRTTRYVDYNGEKIPEAEFARIHDMNISTVRSRLNRGMTGEEILNTPTDSNQIKITIDGVYDTLSNFCDQYGMPREVVRDRIKIGWDPKEALTTPVKITKYILGYGSAIGTTSDFETAMGLTDRTIDQRLRVLNMSVKDAITRPIRRRGFMMNAVFFVDPNTRKPISQFSDLIDTPQYQKDLKTFAELIDHNSNSTD